MRKTDISKYKDEAAPSILDLALSAAGGVFAFLGRIFFSILLAMAVTGIVIGLSLLFYILGIANEPLTINLDTITLNQTSKIYIQNYETQEWEEDKQLYSTENRVWVNFQDIPKQMIDAQIAIEDKRFWEHDGVDLRRTGGAIFQLATGGSQFGGSTITQQLIKNLTDDNENSINRKFREIFRAFKLEKAYSKDDIIETYLNLVNYGSGCRGVQSAANLYFNKDIRDCDVVECAAIAGITQNPYAYDPLTYPENNAKRRNTVLWEMMEQGMMTYEEYLDARLESNELKFVGYIVDSDEDDDTGWGWYDDRLFRDVTQSLQKEFHITASEAEDMIYSKGLSIYSAIDTRAQEIAERHIHEWSTPTDPTLQVAYVMMDFDGRIRATVGGRQEHDGKLLWDICSQSALQPGSTIKPLSSYVIALDKKMINYTSLVSDRPDYQWDMVDGYYVSGPSNWYNSYYGDIPLNRALNLSTNATAVSVLKEIGLDTSYNFLTQKLHFRHLDPEKDSNNKAGLAIGGFHGGTTIEEMTAGYQIFCNGGYCYEPYTFYYVTDHDGNVILDNRDRGRADHVISTETSTIMNRLLHDVVNSGTSALGWRAAIPGWDIIGKTGTTDYAFDNWFMGASPYTVAGIWTGHDIHSSIAIDEQSKVHVLWKDIMQEFLEDKEPKEFELGGDVVQHNYLKSSGLLTDYHVGDAVGVGYYTSDNMPGYSSYNPYYTPSNNNNYNNNNNDDDDDDDDDNGGGDDDDDGGGDDDDDGGGDDDEE